MKNAVNDNNNNKIEIFFTISDATQEYIKGVSQKEYPTIATSGLECVTVLIGLYDKGNGKPLAGVINQPFHEQTDTG